MADYWTAFNWGKYEKNTDELSMTEHGAYFLLLKQYYKTRRPLVANASRLLTVCRAFATHEQEAVASVLARYFTLQDGYYHNATADEELEKASQISEKRRVAGKKGADSKHGKCHSFASDLPHTLPPQVPPQLQLQSFVIPDWIPVEAWKAYEEMRKKIKKPMTDKARQLAVGRLAEFKAEGFSPKEVLEHSTLNCYQGLFPPRHNGNGRTHSDANLGTNRDYVPKTVAEEMHDNAISLDMTDEQYRAFVDKQFNRGRTEQA